MTNPRVLVVADVPDWAWGKKAQQYVTWLSDQYSITVAYMTQEVPDPAKFDLVHLFEVSQLRVVPEECQTPVVAGLTAMVWWTWGAERMVRWAARCEALHGNSLMLTEQLQKFHPRVYYTPNGVDPVFWAPKRDRVRSGFAACHVGKPNPRKGASVIIEACQKADVKLLLVQRTSHIRYTPEQVREFYWSTDVQLSCSDMDGTPNPCFEAASCGNPVISTLIGNMPEFIAVGHNGYLIGTDLLPQPFRPWMAAVSDPHMAPQLPEFARWGSDEARARRESLVDELVARLRYLKGRPDKVDEMGRNARDKTLKAWSWAKQVRYIDEMWRAVLEGAHA